MARRPRNLLPGLPQHVIQRGNNRQAVFFAEADYRLYLDLLRMSALQYGCAIHAYVLMTNHVHMLVTPGKENALSSMMQSVGRRYVRYINSTYQRSGTLWEGRFKASLIDSESYLLTCMCYIELNPVRAGMTEEPGGYRWSSYRFNAQNIASDLIVPHDLYLALGSSSAERQSAYRKLCKDAVDLEVLKYIRSAAQSGEIMGSQRFREEIAYALKRRVEKLPHGGDRKSAAFRKQRSSSTLTP